MATAKLSVVRDQPNSVSSGLTKTPMAARTPPLVRSTSVVVARTTQA